MNDQELLELAAKAAGYKHSHFFKHSNAHWGMATPEGIWNPLYDDGDALRLAVNLKIELKFPVFYNDPDCDRYAVTRQEIVKAAAEIGRRMG